MRPPGPTRPSRGAWSGDPGPSRRTHHPLRLLLIALLAGGALAGLAAPAIAAVLPTSGLPATSAVVVAGRQPPPSPPPPSGSAEPSAPEGNGLPVSGTLRNENGALLSGVRVQALDSSGRPVARTTSESGGRWQLQVPKPGTYTFTIDKASLPKGVQVLQGEVKRSIAEGRVSVVVFRFGTERTGLQSSAASQVVRVLVEGIRFGLIIGITGVGLSLIFGTTGLTNFAHGELVTIGAVVAWALNAVVGLPLILAALLAIVAGGIIGAANDLGIWRPMRLRRAGLIAQLVISIGLAIALRYLVLIFFGGRSEAFTDYGNQVERNYGIVSLTDKDLATIVISLAVMVGIALLLQKTRIGKAMRAVSDNRDLAAASGIDVERVVLFVWILAGALAALGGVLFGLSELSGTVQYEMGFNLLLLMFAGVILGGLGTAYGALVGCLIVGILVQVSAQIIPVDLKYLGGLAVLIVILVIRPQGLLGSRARIG